MATHPNAGLFLTAPPGKSQYWPFPFSSGILTNEARNKCPKPGAETPQFRAGPYLEGVLKTLPQLSRWLRRRSHRLNLNLMVILWPDTPYAKMYLGGGWFGYIQEHLLPPMPKNTGGLIPFTEGSGLPRNAWAAPCWRGHDLIAIMIILDLEIRADLRDLLGPISHDFVEVIDVASKERMKIGGFIKFKSTPRPGASRLDRI
jgi:hypothetical protein